MKRRAITAAEIEAGQAPGGGFTAERLRSWGVRSPLRAGWQRRLVRSGVPARCPYPDGFVPADADAAVPANPLLAFAPTPAPPPMPGPDAVEIFADGSCRKGIGGWGFAVFRGTSEVHSASGGEPNTTNNRMELAAVAAALGWLRPAEAATIRTDSQYVVRGFTEWRHGWRKANWRRPGREPLANADLWEALWALAAARTVEIRWVRGHAAAAGNLRAHALAETGRRQVSRTPPGQTPIRHS